MGDFSNPYNTYVCNRRKVEVINGKGKTYAAVNRLYAGRSQSLNPPLSNPSHMFDKVSRTSSSTTVSSLKSNSLFNGRELKRRRRIAKYKWYAVEGKVKSSLKKGYRWLKRRCSEIVHGF